MLEQTVAELGDGAADWYNISRSATLDSLDTQIWFSLI